MHDSVRLELPCEFINVTPHNPLISKCQIKVCYVSDEPNRNRTVITKEVAREMANSLPGSPIVGYYNEEKQDFEEHNRIIDISNGKFRIKDTTRPYGFVDLGAKVWFQKFLDDGKNEREYLMTEGWIWTGQYPESRCIVDRGNNQSMELAKDFLDGSWTKDINGTSKFFIINEAIVEKLCVLGADVEPCFEGATITSFSLSFDDEFRTKLYSLMSELKETLEKGGTPVFTRYAVEIGDTLWNAVYSHLEQSYPDTEEEGRSIYKIDGIYEEEGQKFAILQSRTDMKYYRMNLDLQDSGLTCNSTMDDVSETYQPASESQFSAEAYSQYEVEYAAKKKEEKEDEEEKNPENEGKSEQKETDNSEDKTEDEEDDEDKKKKSKYAQEKCEKCGKSLDECECKEEKKASYTLEEIPEYVELQSTYSALKDEFDSLTDKFNSLNEELAQLTAFKKEVERKEKAQMIDSFYMLSEDDKSDVLANIDTYSLDDIEAKLSILCVRNRVSFNLEKEGSSVGEGPTTFNLNGDSYEDATTPAWIKAVRAVAKNMNN